MLRGNLQTNQRFMDVLAYLHKRNVIDIVDGFVLIGKEGEHNGNYLPFYGSLVWPVI